MNEWDQIIEKIFSDKYEYISFDIFDTLLLRPFWEPSDLFYFIGIYAKQLNIIDNELDFIRLRRKAEENARIQRIKHVEDITIDEIYESLQKLVKKDCNIDELKKREKELELHFCYKRKSGYELYCKAINAGKKVICISDMYLKEEDIQLLLNNNGYSQFLQIYISGEKRLGKYTGGLYQYIKNDLGIYKNGEILHIGDNYKSDILMAQKNGFETCYLTKAKDMYLDQEKNNNIVLLNERIKRAIEANLKYDNPYIKVESNQNINDIYNEMFKDYNINNLNCRIAEKKVSILTKLRYKIRISLK